MEQERDGVTGYNEISSDAYKSYGSAINTSVNIDIAGGRINGNIYGGGYGYTEYLKENVTANDGGALYGNSNIHIHGTPTINGNIYAAGRGYKLSTKVNIAQMIGTTNVLIEGTPTITGSIFGAGAGLAEYAEMAKLTGNSTITINGNINSQIFGRRRYSKNCWQY